MELTTGSSGAEPFTLIVDCLRYWNVFSVDDLDSHAKKITEFLDESVVERKKLAEETKRWNTLTDEDKVTHIKPLLRLYQKEVDRLTTRAKGSENMFMTVYGQITKAPDHQSGLEMMAEFADKVKRATKLEIENQKLNRELEEFRRDFEDIRNQDVTIRRLEEQIRRYEGEMQQTIEARVSETERRLNDEMAAKLLLQREREEELHQQTQRAMEDARQARQQLELAQQQKSSVELRLESEIQAKQASIDMLTNDIDRMTAVNADLEKEITTLRSGLPESSTNSANAEMEMQLVEKDIKLGELTKKCEDLQMEFSLQKHRWESDLAQLNSRAESAEQAASQLSKTLQGLPTMDEYNKLKSRLQILRVLDIDFEGESASAQVTADSVLRDRARKLESENVKLRSAIVDLEDRINKTSGQMSLLLEESAKKSATIQRLEEDLQHQISGAKSLSSSPVPSASDGAAGDGQSDQSSDLLAIITGQRDRFRSRITTLEDENRALVDQLKATKVELRSVSDDNVKLYQRMKYMQSYGELSKVRGDLEGGDREVEDKYKQIYETSVDPFAVFSKSERTKRMQGLNPAERLVLDTSSFFLANRTTRMILFAYMIVLHLLVFMTTWRLAHTSVKCPDYPGHDDATQAGDSNQ